MTVEQVLVYLLAATAGIFLFLGLAQALGHRPIRSRRRVGRPVDPPSTEEAHIAPAWARPGKSESAPSPEGIASDAADGPYWNLRGNGGMLSTVDDMATFYHALLETNALLKPETRALRFDPLNPGFGA